MIFLSRNSDDRGLLISVDDSALGFGIRRVYWVRPSQGYKRGGHRHKATITGIICLQGACRVSVKSGEHHFNYLLNQPDQMLVLPPQWHRELDDFRKETLLLMVASEHYQKDDYLR